MNSTMFKIKNPEDLEVDINITSSVGRIKFLSENPHRCPGNNWFYNMIDEIISRAEKEIFVVSKSED